MMLFVQLMKQDIQGKGRIKLIGYIRISHLNKWLLCNYSDGVLRTYINEYKVDKQMRLPIDISKLQLNCNDNQLLAYGIEDKTIYIFSVDSIPYANGQTFWDYSSVEVLYYIKTSNCNLEFNNLEFTFPELDYFYPRIKGIDVNYPIDKESNHVADIGVKDYYKNKIDFKFSLNKMNVDCSLGQVTNLCFIASDILSFHHILKCNFENKQKLDFILSTINTIKKLFIFLYRRSNINIDEVKLIDSSNPQKYCRLYFINNDETACEKDLERTITYDLLKNHFDDLIQFVADDKIYIEDLYQNNHKDIITLGRLIEVTAGFEHYCKNNCKVYATVVSKNKAKVRDDIINALEELKKRYNSKLRKKADNYINHIKSLDVTLKDVLFAEFKQNHYVLDPLIKKLYKTNHEELSTYKDIAERISKHRNCFAHGSLDLDIDSNLILDVIVLRWLNHAIVFRRCGYTDCEIYQIISKIFNRRDIPQSEIDEFQGS